MILECGGTERGTRNRQQIVEKGRRGKREEGRGERGREVFIVVEKAERRPRN
jgi:hypothetical protein